MSIPILPSTTEMSGSGYPNLETRRVFEGEDLALLANDPSIGIDEGVVYWDVGVPMVNGRPIIDNTLLPSAERRRGELGVSLLESDSRLTVSLGRIVTSRCSLGQIAFGPPMIHDANGLYSPHTAHNQYDTLRVSLEATGLLKMLGYQGDEVTEIFTGKSANDEDYRQTINFIERMLTILTDGGTVRKPVAED